MRSDIYYSELYLDSFRLERLPNYKQTMGAVNPHSLSGDHFSNLRQEDEYVKEALN